MHSIRSKLLFTLIGALLITGFMTATATYFSAQQEFNKFLDTYLRETAESLKDSLSEQSLKNNDPIIVGLSPSYNIVIQIYDSTSNKIWSRKKHIESDNKYLPLPEKEGFSRKTVNGSDWQTYSLASGSLIITVGQEITVRKELAASSAFKTLQPLCLLLPFITIAIWLIVGEGLAPLERTERSVARRSPSSLAALSTEGLPTELLGLVRAINQLLKRLNDSLTAQQRFASDAAHELRTPLTAIKLQVQLAQRAKTEENRRKCFDRLNHGIVRATRLVEQLLTLTRLDPDACNHPAQTIKLHAIAQSVCEDMLPIAEQKSISISTKTDPTTTEGMEDAIRLMISNLTDNAIRYTQEGGRIEIRTREDRDKAIVEISDNGPGISTKDQKRIFDRFYRSLGNQTSGTGLGLAIVKRISDIHHGTISIVDGLDGQGVTFQIALPRNGFQ